MYCCHGKFSGKHQSSKSITVYKWGLLSCQRLGLKCAFGQCLTVRRGQWSAGFCLQHCRAINAVNQLLGPRVQARARTESCEQAGCLHGVQARCTNSSQPQTYRYILEGFSTLWQWLHLDWGKMVQVLSCRHILGSVHPRFWQGKA